VGRSALPTRTPLSGLFGCPPLDLRAEPELDAALAEVDRRPWHVFVLPLVLEHRVAVREAQDIRYALGVESAEGFVASSEDESVGSGRPDGVEHRDRDRGGRAKQSGNGVDRARA
jgi:hypothetical protein